MVRIKNLINFFRKKTEFLKPLIDEFDIPDMYSRTAEISYYLTLSIFPSFIFLISGFSFIPNINTEGLLINVKEAIPKEVYSIVNLLFQSAIDNRGIRWLVFSLIIASWAFSKSIKALIKGQNMSFGFEEDRSGIKITIFSTIYSAIFFISVILSITFLVYGAMIGNMITNIFNNIIIDILYNTIRFLSIFLLLFFVFLNFFTIGPSTRLKYKQTYLGAFVSTVLWIIFSLAYSYYTNHFGNATQIYGVLSSIIILLTWIYFLSMSITIGYKINSIIYKRKTNNKN